MAIVKNLASVMTTADITSSATSIPVNRTNVFGASQNPLDNPFYVTIMPASGSEPANTTNSEIALVTGISGSNLIVTRGQRSTTARAFTSGAIVTNGIYAEDAVLLGEAGTAVNPSPWVDTSEIVNGAITTAKIADESVTTAKLAPGIVTTTRTLLFQSSSDAGQTGNIDLISGMSIEGWDAIEFWIRDNNSPPNQGIITIPGDARTVTLDLVHTGGSNTAYWNMKKLNWPAGQTTTLTLGANYYQKAITSNGISSSATENIRVLKIYGIKYVSN